MISSQILETKLKDIVPARSNTGTPIITRDLVAALKTYKQDESTTKQLGYESSHTFVS